MLLSCIPVQAYDYRACASEVYTPPLCHSSSGSKICHQVNTHLHQADQNLISLFLDKNSDESKSVYVKLWVLYQSGWQFMLGVDEKMQPRFVDFPISPRVLVSLVGRLFLRPGSFRKLTRWDFARSVTQGCFILGHRDTGMACPLVDNFWMEVLFLHIRN